MEEIVAEKQIQKHIYSLRLSWGERATIVIQYPSEKARDSAAKQLQPELENGTYKAIEKLNFHKPSKREELERAILQSGDQLSRRGIERVAGRVGLREMGES